VPLNGSLSCLANRLQIKAKFRSDYVKAVKAGLRIWPAAELLNQSLVPLKWRSLVKDVVGFGWDMYLNIATRSPVAAQPAGSGEGDECDAATSDSGSGGGGGGAGAVGGSGEAGDEGSDEGSDEGGEEVKGERPAAPAAALTAAPAAAAKAPTLANPATPFSFVVLAAMYWADKRGYAQARR